MGAMTGPDGLLVEQVVLLRGHGPQSYLRATRRGYLIGDGYFRTVEDLAAVVDLAQLRPDERRSKVEGGDGEGLHV